MQSARRVSPFLFAVLAALVPAGFSRGEALPASPAPAAPAVAAAKVNGVVISAAKLEREVKRVSDSLAAQASALPDPAVVRREVLDRLISTEVIWQQVRSDKAIPGDVEVDAELVNLRKRFKDPKGLDAVIQGEGLTPAQFREEVRRDLGVRRWLEKTVEPGIPATSDDDVRGYYESHPDEFARPESIAIRHILIHAPKDGTPAAKLEAKKRADAALARVRKGEDFAAVAKEVSEDSGSAPRGGDLGVVARGQAPPAFESMVFMLEKGGISDVIATDYGFHVVQVTDKIAAGKRTLDEVKDRLRQFLDLRKRQEAMQKTVTGLRARAKVEEF